MDFQEVDRQYAELKRRYDAGTLSAEEFDSQLREMMVQDSQGRWWAKTRDTGQWSYHDGAQWVPGTPPGLAPSASGGGFTPPPPTGGARQYETPVADGPTPYGGTSGGSFGSTGGGYQQPVAQAAAVPGGAEISKEMSIVLYLASFFVPLAGFIIYFMYKDKPAESDRKVAQYSLYISLGIIFLYCACCACSFLPGLMAGV